MVLQHYWLASGVTQEDGVDGPLVQPNRALLMSLSHSKMFHLHLAVPKTLTAVKRGSTLQAEDARQLQGTTRVFTMQLPVPGHWNMRSSSGRDGYEIKTGEGCIKSFVLFQRIIICYSSGYSSGNAIVLGICLYPGMSVTPALSLLKPVGQD